MKSLLATCLFVLLGLSSSFAQSNYTIQGQIDDLAARSKLTSTTITTGTSTTLTASKGTKWVIVDPASTLAAHTIFLPSNPGHGHTLVISFGGTITSGAVVTSLTISPNTGQSILQTSAPTAGAAGGALSYRYNALINKWYRQY